VACVPDPTVAGRPIHHAPEYFGAAAEQPTDRRLGLSRVAPPSPPTLSPLGGQQPWSLPRRPGFFHGSSVLVSFGVLYGMLRTLLDEIVGRLRQFGSHADSLEDENHRLRAELSALFEARRENDDTFTVRQWDLSGTRLVARVALDCSGVQSD
jgi:hypothetical protein